MWSERAISGDERSTVTPIQSQREERSFLSASAAAGVQGRTKSFGEGESGLGAFSPPRVLLNSSPERFS